MSGISTKSCSTCGEIKPLPDFNRQKDGGLGRRSRCRACEAGVNRAGYEAKRVERLAKAKARAEADPIRHRGLRRAQKIKRLYGLSVQDVERMRAEQGDACFICRQVRPLKIDHCHASGAVRKLLCGPCNTGLGLFSDNPELLEAAASYLRESRK